MKITSNISELRLLRKELAPDLAFIPTMGALHDGHLSLISLAKSQAQSVAVSIFVNPTQFNNPEDLKTYPRDIEADLEKLKKVGVDLVFTPDTEEIYTEGFQTSIALPEISKKMEGEFRPGHFEGVATIVTTLLNIIQPRTAIFGEKDFQQLCLIKQLVRDLKIPVEIFGAPIFREESGLALSSRNALLSKADRTTASKISKGLSIARAEVAAGTVDCEKVLGECHQFFKNEKDITIEYLTIANSRNLESQKEISDSSRIFFAGSVAGVRLIDNMELAS